jgi:hypothetical protein
VACGGELGIDSPPAAANKGVNHYFTILVDAPVEIWIRGRRIRLAGAPVGDMGGAKGTVA